MNSNPVQNKKTIRVGDRVSHKSYGNGNVVSLDERYIDVQFLNHRAKFHFPDAFEKGYLTYIGEAIKEPVTIPDKEIAAVPLSPSESDKQDAVENPKHIEIAQMLFEKHPTMSALRKHYAEYVIEYGKEEFNQIYKIVQRLRQEAQEQEAMFDPAKVYSQNELSALNITLAVLIKAPDPNVRRWAAEMKGRYHSMAGIVAACYPHQMENGRPAKKSKNSSTGVTEWHPYKRVTFSAAENIYIELLENYISKTGKGPIITIHQEGEDANKGSLVARTSLGTFSVDDCLEQIQGAYSNLEIARDEEQDAFDNMPEGLQESDRGVEMEENIEALDDAISALDDAISSLQEATSISDDYNDLSSVTDEGYEVGNTLKHKFFGKGVVTSVQNNEIIVSFKHRIARFANIELLKNCLIPENE